MTDVWHCVLTGPEALHPDQPTLRLSTHLCLASHGGSLETLAQKQDGNEDILMARGVGATKVFMAADAHFGIGAAQWVLDYLLRQDAIPERLEELFKLQFTLDRIIKEQQTRHPRQQRSATTLALAVLLGRQLLFVNTGDSQIMVLRKDTLYPLTRRTNGLYLGNFPHCSQLLTEELTWDPWPPPWETMAYLSALCCGIANHESLSDQEKEAALRKALKPFPNEARALPLSRLVYPWHPLNTHAFQWTPECGTATLEPGDLLFLMTDGLFEHSCLPWTAYGGALAQTAMKGLPSLAKEMLHHPIRQSVEDNASVLLYAYHP
jgi:serine/threonine protein phosphatase PrpC